MKPSPKPTRPLDWTGGPYDPSKGERYMGREVLSVQSFTERMASMRARMAHARSMRKRKTTENNPMSHLA